MNNNNPILNLYYLFKRKGVNNIELVYTNYTRINIIEDEEAGEARIIDLTNYNKQTLAVKYNVSNSYIINNDVSHNFDTMLTEEIRENDASFKYMKSKLQNLLDNIYIIYDNVDNKYKISRCISLDKFNIAVDGNDVYRYLIYRLGHKEDKLRKIISNYIQFDYNWEVLSYNYNNPSTDTYIYYVYCKYIDIDSYNRLLDIIDLIYRDYKISKESTF
jgi:hypothetical protein